MQLLSFRHDVTDVQALMPGLLLAIRRVVRLKVLLINPPPLFLSMLHAITFTKLCHILLLREKFNLSLMIKELLSFLYKSMFTCYQNKALQWDNARFSPAA